MHAFATREALVSCSAHPSSCCHCPFVFVFVRTSSLTRRTPRICMKRLGLLRQYAILCRPANRCAKHVAVSIAASALGKATAAERPTSPVPASCYVDLADELERGLALLTIASRLTHCIGHGRRLLCNLVLLAWQAILVSGFLLPMSLPCLLAHHRHIMC